MYSHEFTMHFHMAIVHHTLDSLSYEVNKWAKSFVLQYNDVFKKNYAYRWILDN